MRGLTVQPGVANSIELTELPEIEPATGNVLLQALALGVCGTDREIITGEYGEAPKGDKRLVLGHESLARVLEAPSGSGFKPDDLVVPMVRRPDPVPCPNCAVGEWDMCKNGLYTEHGIRGEHGFGVARFQLEPARLVKLDPALGANGVLLEPASVLAKAWEHIERIGRRARWAPERVLVTGAGPIGLLAALMARQRGLEVHVLDIVKEGPKPRLVKQLGATYHSDGIDRVEMVPDVTLECTGVASLVIDAMCQSAHGGITCLTGVSSGGRQVSIDIGSLNKTMVLENDVVFGTVNANRRHYEAAAASLAQADPAWLSGLITRRVPLTSWQQAFERRDNDVKVVIDFETR